MWKRRAGALLGDRKRTSSNSASLDDCDGVLKIQVTCAGEDSVEEQKHLVVRVGATSEENKPGTLCETAGEKSRVVQVCGHDDAPFFVRNFQNFLIRGARESGSRGMDGIMAGGLEPANSQWRNRHLDEEPQPVTMSTVSSSARLAA